MIDERLKIPVIRCECLNGSCRTAPVMMFKDDIDLDREQTRSLRMESQQSLESRLFNFRSYSKQGMTTPSSQF